MEKVVGDELVPDCLTMARQYKDLLFPIHINTVSTLITWVMIENT